MKHSLSLSLSLNETSLPKECTRWCLRYQLEPVNNTSYEHCIIRGKHKLIALSSVHSTKEDKRQSEMADQYSLKHHVMMMIMIMIAIRKATMVSTKLQKANKKKTLKKISPNIAEFRRINKYQPNNNYFIFYFHGATDPSEPGLHDHTQTHHAR